MQEIIFGLFGGLGLFVLGIKFLSDSLQKIAGTRIRRVLHTLIGNRFQGVAVGAVVTSIIQSSSVTTVLLAGLINAGIVSLKQAVSVVIGANIGTTITAQILAFKLSAYALPAIGVGVAMIIMAKRKQTQFWGNFILSLGLIFLGLVTMSEVMRPLKDLPEVAHFFVSLSSQPLLLMLVGNLFTFLVQSSSAAMGVVLAMANAGLIDFTAAVYLVLAMNIGTTMTAWLASIGGAVSTRRMACFHSLFNIVGVVYFYFFVQNGAFLHFVDYVTPGEITPDTMSRHIANAHTLFNVFNAIVFLIILDLGVKFSMWLIPGKDNFVSSDVRFLQEALLPTPELAIESTKKELAAMGDTVRKTVTMAVEGFITKDKSHTPYVQTHEDAVDHLQHDVTYYITKISYQPLTQEQSEQLPSLLHSVNDLERISDHALNITELTERAVGDDLQFSSEAIREMSEMAAKIDDMFEQTIRVIEHDDPASVERVLLGEKMIDGMHQEYRERHVKRLVQGKCHPLSALVFVEFINNMERVADHLNNIVEAAKRGFIFDGKTTSSPTHDA